MNRLLKLLTAGLLLTIGIAQHSSIHQRQLEEQSIKKDPVSDLVYVQTGLDILLAEKRVLVEGKKVGLVTNQTGINEAGIHNYTLLIDDPKIHLAVIFSPEHGFKGEAGAGEKVEYGIEETGYPRIESLYGKSRKPTISLLRDLDWIIYDIQDIGSRFYTYISTLGLVMEAAGEAGIPVLVLDRPIPVKGENIEGPCLNPKYKSFVGYYPIPIRYGLTVGELATIIAGEKWIDPISELEVIEMKGWKRNLWYDETSLLWISPSPNIPNLETALVYPGNCIFEATNVSEGRGTEKPFLWIGAPWINGVTLSQALNKKKLDGVVFQPISFTPKEIRGVAKNPKYEGIHCYGVEVIVTDRNVYNSVRTGVNILKAINSLYPNDLEIMESTMNKLWGNTNLMDSISKGTELNFKKGLVDYNKLASKYRIYD